MALAAVVDTIESVPEALRGEYAEKDGKFYLNLEGVDNHHAVGGLKSALTTERQANKALKELKTKYDSLGLSHEEIETMIARDTEAATKALKAKGDVEGILKQHQEKWGKERATLENELNVAKASERSAIVGERVLGALAKANATQEGTDLLPERLAARIKFETVDGKRVLKILSDDGATPMAGTGADGTATIDDLVKEAMTKYPSLFKGSGAGGGGKPPGEKGGGGSGVGKKSDLKTMKAKGDYVEKYGMEAYEALPA